MFQPYDEPFSHSSILDPSVHVSQVFPTTTYILTGEALLRLQISLQSRNHPATTKHLYALNTLNNRSSQYVFWCISDADNVGLTQKPVLENMQKTFQDTKSHVCTPSSAET